MRNLEGKTAIVTGGVRGLGLGLATAFVDAGMQVIVTYNSSRSITPVLRYLNDRAKIPVHALRLDVTDRASVADTASKIRDRFGGLNLLCNNAGIGALNRLPDTTFDEWQYVLSTNLNGVFNCIKGFLDLLMANRGNAHILNVASMSAFIANPGAAAYTASKFAVRGFTECLRLDLAQCGIGVSLLCPGLTDSNFWDRSRGAANHPDGRRESRGHRQRAGAADFYFLGMHPEIVGQRAVNGIRNNILYIITHPEFRDEIEDQYQELIQAIPAEPVERRRLIFEKYRKAIRKLARSKSDLL